MDLVNLLQNAAIIVLSSVSVLQTVRLHSVNETLDKRIRELAKSSVKRNPTLVEAEQERIMNLYLEHEQVVSVRWEKQDDESASTPRLNSDLFRKGDSVQLSGLEGEYILTGYQDKCFTACKTTRDQSISTKVVFPAEKVKAWKRNTGEWPLDWVTRSGDDLDDCANATNGDDPCELTLRRADLTEPIRWQKREYVDADTGNDVTESGE